MRNIFSHIYITVRISQIKVKMIDLYWINGLFGFVVIGICFKLLLVVRKCNYYQIVCLEAADKNAEFIINTNLYFFHLGISKSLACKKSDNQFLFHNHKTALILLITKNIFSIPSITCHTKKKA